MELLLLILAVVTVSLVVFIAHIVSNAHDKSDPTDNKLHYVSHVLVGNDVIFSVIYKNESFQFRGKSTMWYHYPDGVRAGRMWGIHPAFIDSQLSDMYVKYIEWKV